jgi:BioD-like phosphotransacetylase family protein
VLLLWQRVSTRIVTQRLFVTASAVFCLLFLGGHAATAGIIAVDHYRNGLDYTSWRHAEILEAAREVPDDVIVYSNRYDALFALHGIHARSLPQKLSDFHQTTSADRSDIFIVYFYDMEDSNRTGWLGSSVVLSEDELIAQLDLHRVAQTTDGAIYVLAANE